MLNSEFIDICNEALDMKDIDTVRTIAGFTESQQQNVAVINLANRLYGMITDKLENIDYGTIPKSQGNIATFEQYKRTRECISVLKGMAKQSNDGDSTREVAVIEDAFDNIEKYKVLFTRGYKYDISVIKYTYNSILLGIISDIGFMTSACVEFIKNPNNTVGMEIKNLQQFKSKFGVVHNTLRAFNEACDKGEIEKAFNPLIKIKMAGFKTESAIIQHEFSIPGIGAKALSVGGKMAWSALGSIPGGQLIVGLVAASIILIKVIIPMLRQSAYLFYAMRVSISAYFTLQEQLLRANVLKVKSSSVQSEEEKQKIIAKQLKYADWFHRIANIFALKYTPAEREANNAGRDKTNISSRDGDPNDDSDVTLF